MAKFEYTKEHIKSSKLALLLGAITAGVADIFVVVLLMIAGLWSYVALPIILAVADLTFLVIALFTNFRFRYSMTYVITYLSIFIGCVIGHLLVIRGGAETAMTAVALIIWVAVHILNFVVIMLGAKGALTRQKSHHLATALVVILFIISVGVYIGFGSAEGYFGQGSLTARPVVYMYDEKTDSYTVTGVLDGSGKFAVIPEKFDGKPVRAIDASIFTADRLDRLEIQTTSNVSLLNLNTLSGITVQEISAPRETLTSIQRELYTAYRDEGKNAELLTLAARTAPSDLQEGEIYITFTYTDTALDCVGETFLPSWIGHKGDRFNLSELSDSIDYIQNTDNTDEALLHELYTSKKQGSGYILLPIMLDAKTPLNGAMIQKSHKNVVVDFEKIYRVEIQEDNDTLYTMPPKFTSIFVNGEDIHYRYVTPTTIARLLSSAEKREGFTIEWEYGYGNGFTLPEATTSVDALLATLDGREENKFTIKPTWTLNAPVINSLGTNSQSGVFTYGDRVNFNVNATAPAAGTELSYNWYFGETFLTSTESYEIPVILMNQNGEYTVKVSASSSTVTSLTSEASRSTTITVSKKEIDISWNGINDLSFNLEYDSLYHNIGISYNENDLVTPTGASRDIFSYELSQNSIKNAGSYEISITLTGDADTKYTLRQNERKQVYVITQKPVDIEWSNLIDLVYNAQSQKPSVTITGGICEGDSVSVSIPDMYAQTNAGNYNATATLNNSNYTIRESETKEFSILKKDITITWSDETNFTYNKTAQGPTPSTTGIEAKDLSQNVKLTRTNTGINVGTYTVGVSINSDNYRIVPEGSTKEYTIDPKTVSVEWLSSTVVYTATKQYPNNNLIGVVDGDSVSLSYEVADNLGAVNVGTYTVTARSQNPNYVLNADTNYHTYDITKKTVYVKWENNTQTYAHRELLPSYSIIGMLGSDTYGDSAGNSIVISLSGAQMYVCENAPIKMTYTSQNYEIQDVFLSTTLTIERAEITLKWTNNSFTYNAEEQIPTVTIANGAIPGDSVAVEVAGAQITPGDHKATATLTNDNYVIKAGQEEYAFSILKKTLNPEWSNLEFNYNGTAHNPTVILNGILDSDIGKVTYTISEAKTNAGTYTATIALDGMKDCYTLSSSTKSFTIHKAVVTPNWSNLEWTYNKTPYTPEVTFNGVFGSDVVNASFNRGAATNAGSYEFTVTVTNGNYTVKEDTTRTMVIKPRAVTVSFTGSSFVYNGNVQRPAYEIGGILGGDNAAASLNATGKDAGSYTATLTIGNKNYVAADDTSLSFIYEITPATLTINWGKNAFVFDNTAKFPAYTLSGLVPGEIESLLGVTKSTKTDAGNYNVTYEITNTNYTVANGEYTMSISPRQVTPNFTKLSFTYNGSMQTPLYTLESIPGYDYASKVTPSEGRRDAGDNYPFELTLNDPNVTLVGAETTFSIKPLEVTITWSNTALTYNGTEQLPTAKIVGLITADEATVSLNITGAQTHVGNYTAEVQIQNSSNYTIRSGHARHSFIISTKKVSIVWTNYTGLTYNGSEQQPVATFGTNAILEGDSCEIVYKKSGEINAGTYTMEIELNNPDYEILYGYNTKEYTIAKAKITVHWNGLSAEYDGYTHQPTAVAQDVNGKAFNFTYTFKKNGSTVTSPKEAGTYTVTITFSSTADAKNYEIQNPTTDFVITEKD